MDVIERIKADNRLSKEKKKEILDNIADLKQYYKEINYCKTCKRFYGHDCKKEEKPMMCPKCEMQIKLKKIMKKKNGR